MIGVVIREPDPTQAVDNMVAAEKAGVPAVWVTTAGSGRDGLTLLAAAARVTSLQLGTSIMPTWPRHPVALAQQAQVVAALSSRRLRLGIGPADQGTVDRMFGLNWRNPLQHLREYIVILKALLQTGSVDFDGKQLSAHATLLKPVDVPVLASALREGAFRLCGEVADGAISWMAPVSYLKTKSLPAMRAGAEAAGRDLPKLYLHVPVCVAEDEDAAIAAAKEQVGQYVNLPRYAAMFVDAGYDLSNGFSESQIRDLVIYGSAADVATQLRALHSDLADEVLAHPLLVGEDRESSLHAVFDAVAAANV